MRPIKILANKAVYTITEEKETGNLFTQGANTTTPFLRAVVSPHIDRATDLKIALANILNHAFPSQQSYEFQIADILNVLIIDNQSAIEVEEHEGEIKVVR